MSKGDLLFNGHKYTPVDPTPESREIESHWPGLPANATISCSLNGQPAIIHGGQPYTQGERLIPGTSIDWTRLNGRR